MNFVSHIKTEASMTVAINSIALEKKSKGERIYNLSAGEPMIAPHPVVVKAANEAIEKGKTQYPPLAGIGELRNAATEWMNTTYNTNYEVKNVLVTCGGKFGIFATFQSYIQPSDEVLIIAPYWVSYPQLVSLFGGTPKIVPTTEDKNWKITIEQLEKNVSEKTKFLIINNGANPTGTLYTKDELEKIVNWAVEHNIFILSDEVYSGLAYDNNKYISLGSFSQIKDRLILIQSCSKHFAMTGWRVGFVFAPEQVIKTLSNIQSQSTTGTSSISQWAALGAIQNHSEVIASVNSEMKKRRDIFIETLSNLFNKNFKKPECGLYSFVALSELGVSNIDSAAFCKYLIEQHNIAAVPGIAFGQEGYIRFSFGDKEVELIEALHALKQAVDEYNK